MFNRFKKVLLILLVAFFSVTLVFAQSISEAKHGKYEGKTIILHSNDVHGALEGYAKMAYLRDEFVAEGADVVLVDNGDFAQGSIYVADSKGNTAVQMMDLVGYDIVGIGNHEFDYGFSQLKEDLEKASFEVICSNVYGDDGNTIYGKFAFHTTPEGAVIGFFTLDTPETQTKANPVLTKGLKFEQGQALYDEAQKLIDELASKSVDTLICIAHLGVNEESKPNRSIDIMQNTHGIDFMIDGHSHTVFSGYEDYPMQQTGTKFANIGVIIIDGKSGDVEDYYLVECSTVDSDPKILEAAHKIMQDVDAKYGEKFAESTVELNGDRTANRTGETNLGDLVADALLWGIVRDPDSLTVQKEDVVCIINGGGLRDWIHKGDVSRKDTNNVLPFANTLTVVYATGSMILEVLEASTFSTPNMIGGFPQISGMDITIDTTKAYDEGDLYPASTYHKPNSINRVTVKDINGNPFDKDATYAVVTNDFCAGGGDTYYAFAASDNKFDTGLMLDDVLVEYITEVLNKEIGDQYLQPQGRIEVVQ